MTRRQWLLRAGGALLVPSVLSSCRPDISRDVRSVGERLASAYHPLSEIDCVACDNCMPCPYGIDIPSNFIFVDRALREGAMPGALDDPDFAEKGRKFLLDYEDKFPDKVQSQHCISCGQCVPTCPVKINIPQQMSNITALTDVLRDLRCQQI
ncbi:MAG: hypothetical protein NC212_00950 [Staphylococcus sp.]|nr:hypothetical protein [Staphylococcus sp.]